MNLLETIENEDIFAYFDVQNLSIDHSLTLSEVEQYKDLIFSPNSLHQIYFKGSCNLETIELIKNLLTISEYADDSKIDKYILLELSDEDKKKLLEETYEFPSTWKLPYELVDDNFSLTDIPNYRTLQSFINKLSDSNLSSLEQIMKVYDSVKMMEYDSSDEVLLLPEIIRKKKANSFGMNKLFSYILNSLGYKTFIGEMKSKDVTSYITLVEIEDKKYGVNGIYLFDPSMDNLPKEKYPKDEVRRVNYNFFALPLEFITRLSYGERPTGMLLLLSIDLSYSLEKLDITNSSKIIKEKKRLLDTFSLTFEQLFNKLRETKQIPIETILSVNDALYSDKKEKYNDILKENYEIRKNELFTKNVEEELEEFVKEEKV